MEILTYNNVPLQVIASKEISRKHIYTDDGTTYLHTQWTFDVTATLNQQAIAIALVQAGVIQFVPIGQQDQVTPPASLDVAIREAIKQPRRALTFSQSVDGQNFNVVLNIPAGSFPVRGNDPLARNSQNTTFLTDCANGPFVEDFDVLHDIAQKTWMVAVRIVARVRECQFTHGSGIRTNNPIISNRYHRTVQTTGEQGGYLSYVRTDGEVIFDSAWLLANGGRQLDGGIIRWADQNGGQIPDQFRFDLFQPIPPNCHRSEISVTQVSDGITYRYSFTDQERHFNTLPACHLEVYKTHGFSQTGAESAFAGQMLESIPAVMNNVQGAINTAALNLGAATVFAIGAGTANFALQMIARQIPKFSTNILVRAWGTRDTPKWALLQQALGIATSHFVTFNNIDMTITYECTGKWVELNITNTTGPEAIVALLKQQFTAVKTAAKRIIAGAAQGNPNLGAILGNTLGASIIANRGAVENVMLNTPEDDPSSWYDQDETAVVAAYRARLAAEPSTWGNSMPDATTKGNLGNFYGNAQPPHSNYTRGSLICNLIAQALQNPCVPAPCPVPAYDASNRPFTMGDLNPCSPPSNPYIPIVPGTSNPYVPVVPGGSNPYIPISEPLDEINVPDPQGVPPPSVPNNPWDEVRILLDDLAREVGLPPT